ncbi:hypothetical protein [Streptomyces narbonensis]|uniref:hypothetical protein n=1 Tax=Streptomyces narbonensis TaxID=67333 RepID=UPI00198824F4|nr:hypothetical protein [Streptomyces narbonensis]GGW01294.1 hypothetical protein GCM10010230_31330 [Streptomyces narbonensis]
MTGRRTPHLPSKGPELLPAAPFAPRLGDLAADTTHNGRVGVVVALPGEDSATTYHLRPPGGGPTWSAPADGSTLLPVPAQITHATLPAGGGAVYEPRTGQGSVPVVFHFADGSTSEGALTLTSAELERLHAQIGRLLASHDKASGLE